MTKLTVGKIVFGQERKMPYELAINSNIINTNKLTETIPSWMIISALRYALGRKTVIVHTTCEWLIKNWFLIDMATKKEIKNCVNDAFADYSRCKHLPNLKYHSPLGMPCDVKEWEKVRNLWKKTKKNETSN